MFLVDFDYTLTRMKNLSENAKRGHFSTFCVLEYCEDLPKEYSVEKDNLFQIYHKYEDDLTIDLKVRDEMMKTW